MTGRWCISLVVAVVVLLGGHALTLRLLIDHEVAGALLASGGSMGTVLAAAGGLILRLVTVLVVTSVPALVVIRAARCGPGGGTRPGSRPSRA